MGWIGVDLDGTLAEYHGWDGGRIGAPLMPMVNRVKGWLREGKDVRIVSARVADPYIAPSQLVSISMWCEYHIGRVLPVTASKDFEMVELWDDRAVQVVRNVGEPTLARVQHRYDALVSTLGAMLRHAEEQCEPY